MHMSQPTALYTYQFSYAVFGNRDNPEGYGQVSYSNNVFHDASVQNMQLVEYINVAPAQDTLPVFPQRNV